MVRESAPGAIRSDRSHKQLDRRPLTRNYSALRNTISKERSMREESFLRYRLDVARTMPEGPYKAAVIASINAKILALGGGSGVAR